MNQGWSFEGGIFDTYFVFLVLIFLPKFFLQIRSSIRFISIESYQLRYEILGKEELLGPLLTLISF